MDVIVVEDDIPASKMTEQAGESRHERVKGSLSQDSSPELFSDPAECGDGIADSGGSREDAKGGRSSNNATNAKEEGVLDNQQVIEIDKDHGDTFTQQRIRETINNNDVSSPPSVRGKSLIGQSTTNLVSE